MEKELHKEKAYPAYKDSGIDWIGEIPEHWEVRKLKYYGEIHSGLSGKSGPDFPDIYKEGFKPYVPFTNICNNFVIESDFDYVRITKYETQFQLKVGDICFLMSSETLEDIGKTALLDQDYGELYLNSFCKVFRLYDTRKSKYLNYLFQSNSQRSYFSLKGRGFTRINLKQSYILNNMVIQPPLPEQEAIVEHIETQSEKIDKAINIQEAMIEKLKEYKKVLINELVTGKRRVSAVEAVFDENQAISDD